MNTNGDFGRSINGVGFEKFPSYTFGSEPSTGVYLESPGTASSYTISKNGAKRFRITNTKTQVIGVLQADSFTPTGAISLPDGSASAPSLSFVSDSKTGLFADTKDGEPLAFSVGGSIAGYFDSTKSLNVVGDISAQGNVFGSDVLVTNLGTVASPSFAFFASSGTGFSFPATEPSALVCSNQGQEYWRAEEGPSGVTRQLKISKPVVSTSSGTFTNYIASSLGTAPTPPYTFTGQTTSGLYYEGTGATQGISITSAGTKTLTSTSTSIQTYVPISTGTNGITSGSMTTGALSSSSVNSSGTISAGGISTTGAYLAAVGSATAPSYSFTGTTDRGLYNVTAGSMAGMSVGVGGSLVAAFTASGFRSLLPINALTSALIGGSGIFGGTFGGTGSVSCGSLLSSGTMSCGTNAFTCGPLTSSSTGSFTDFVSSKRVYTRLAILTSNTVPATAILNGASSTVAWNTEDTTGGTSSNWTFVSGATVTVPFDGLYQVSWGVCSTVVGPGAAWITINGGAYKYAFSWISAAANSTTASFTYKFTATNTIQLTYLNQTGSSARFNGLDTTSCYLEVNRLSEG